MKCLALIPVVLVASCAPRPQLVIRATPPPAVDPIDSVRYGEVIRAYHAGRFVDPNHPESMHEQHPLYRIEASARWNLHPAPLGMANPLNPPLDAAITPPPNNDVVAAELNRQREATQRILSEAARLTQAYDDLQAVIVEMQKVAKNNLLVGSRITSTEQRLVEFSKELRKLTLLSSPPTNDAPTPVRGPTDTSTR